MVYFDDGSIEKFIESLYAVCDSSEYGARRALDRCSQTVRQEVQAFVECYQQHALHVTGDGTVNIFEQMYQLSKKLNDSDEFAAPLLISKVLIDQVARREISKFTGIAQAITELALLETPESTSPRGRKFLSRIARTFISGLHAECIVMCRSAMEAELEAEISGDECISVLGRRMQANFNLIDRIAVASNLHRISERGRELADFVRRTANSAVHRDPESSTDIKDVIAATLRVLWELDASRRG